jgi:hypothetical protein
MTPSGYELVFRTHLVDDFQYGAEATGCEIGQAVNDPVWIIRFLRRDGSRHRSATIATPALLSVAQRNAPLEFEPKLFDGSALSDHCSEDHSALTPG